MRLLTVDCGYLVGEPQSRLLVLGAPLHSLGMLKRPGYVLFVCLCVRVAILLNGCTIGLVDFWLYTYYTYTAVFCRTEVLFVFSEVACRLERTFR
jgi:hypothetical protein